MVPRFTLIVLALRAILRSYHPPRLARLLSVLKAPRMGDNHFTTTFRKVNVPLVEDDIHPMSTLSLGRFPFCRLRSAAGTCRAKERPNRRFRVPRAVRTPWQRTRRL